MGITTSPQATILAVDDQPDNLRLLATLLSDRGYKVRKALNGQLALTTIQVSPPDLVLLDINMPDMNGYEVCAQLKASESSRDIPIIFVSGLGEVIDKVKAFEVGAADYITKPFQLEEVIARVEHQLTIRRQQAQIQAQNQQLQTALRQEQHLNDLKSRFVSMVSHEFRNPLTTILMTTELLLSGKSPPEKTHNHLIRIRQLGNELTHLVDEVLDLSQVESGKLEFAPRSLNLTTFCQELVDEMRSSLGSRHNLVLIHPDTDITADLDQQILRHILTNLFSNAIKYSPDGSTVTFILTCQPTAVCLQVQDQGIGIPDADQAHLFTAFHRAGNVDKIPGTGLGLNIVKTMVDLHGGKLTVSSQVGMGSTFTVELPKHCS